MSLRPLIFLSPIHKASRQIGIHLEQAMHDLPVSNQEGHLLSYARSYGPCAISEIQRVFGWKRSTLTSILDRLESRSLITRAVHPEDRRSFLVRLTPEGAELAERVRQRISAFEDTIQSRITEDDLRGFRNVMESIASVADVALSPGTIRKEKS